MVTVTLEHPAVARVQTATTVQTREATLRDASGQPLAIIELASLPDGDELMLGQLDDQYWLMTYYLGRGGRDIMLMLDDRAVHARLETRWEENHRIWWLDFRAD